MTTETPETSTLPGEANEEELSPREQAMAELEVKRMAEFQSELRQGGMSDEQIAATLGTADAGTENQNIGIDDEDADSDGDTPKPVAETPPAAPTQTVRVKVDGQEQDVALDEVIRNFQKTQAADARLREATRLFKEAEAARASATTFAPQPETPAVDISATKQEFFDALMSGDEETASQKFDAMLDAKLQAVKAEGRDPVAIPDAATIAASVKQQLVIESALEQSRTAYPQLYADPDIEQLGAIKLGRKMEDGLDFVSALRQTETEFAEKFGWSATGRQESNATTTARAEKLKQKQALAQQQVPTASATANIPQPEAEDASAVIRQMREARGLPV